MPMARYDVTDHETARLLEPAELKRAFRICYRVVRAVQSRSQNLVARDCKDKSVDEAFESALVSQMQVGIGRFWWGRFSILECSRSKLLCAA